MFKYKDNQNINGNGNGNGNIKQNKINNAIPILCGQYEVHIY